MNKSWLLSFCSLAVCTILHMDVMRVSAFTIDFNSFGPVGINKFLHDGPPVHETITIEAIRSRTEGPMSENLIEMIKRGVQNTDYTHQFQAEYHFDNATLHNGSNGGFNRGFTRITADLDQAIMYAQGNPMFLNPPSQTFYAIASKVIDTITACEVNFSCSMRVRRVAHGVGQR